MNKKIKLIKMLNYIQELDSSYIDVNYDNFMDTTDKKDHKKEINKLNNQKMIDYCTETLEIEGIELNNCINKIKELDFNK